MSVQTTASEVTYAGNGSTSTPYAVPFPFFGAADLIVTVITAGVEGAPLALTSGYTATGGDGSTGNVRTVAAVASTSTVRIRRGTPITQPTSYDNVGRFPAQAHERALDRLTYIAQELQRQLNGLRLIDGGTP